MNHQCYRCGTTIIIPPRYTDGRHEIADTTRYVRVRTGWTSVAYPLCDRCP